jgi:hypothetical protein
MPVLFVATIALQVMCVVHAVRTGRTQPWLFVIIFLPLVGSIAYFLVEILPGMANDRRAQKVFSDVKTIIDPDREYRDRKAQVELSGTPAAKAALADECSLKGMHDDAVQLYRSALTGLWADDANLLMGLARALSEKGDFAEVQSALDHLRAKNPEFQSSDGHLLYARALEGQGKTGEALKEYEAVAGYFPGYEAKVRFALFLTKIGEVAKAREIFEGIVNAYKQLPRHAQDLNRDWYNVARQNLQA